MYDMPFLLKDDVYYVQMNKLDKNSTRVSKKQRRMAAAHLQGESNVEIGKIEYPTAKPKSQRQIVHQQLNRPAVQQYMEQAKLQAMKQHNIGWHRVMAVIDRGLDAKKTDHYSGIEIDDIGTQLRAAKQASDYMEVKTKDDTNPAAPLNLPKDFDEIQLVRAFKSPPHKDL